MGFNPSIDVNAWKSIQWSADVPKLDTQLTELALKLSTWCTSAGQVLTTGAIPWSGLTGKPALFPPSGYYGTDVTNSSAYTILVSSDFTLHAGVVVFFSVSNVNTIDSPTLNVNSSGAKTISNRAGIAILTGELVNSRIHGAMYDGSVWRIFTKLVRLFNSGVNNPTVECLGYDEVRFYASYTSGTSGITLAHLVEGTLVFVDFYNGTGGAMFYYINGTTTANAVMVSWYIGPGLAGTGATRFDSSTGASAANGSNVCLIGQVIGTSLYFK